MTIYASDGTEVTDPEPGSETPVVVIDEEGNSDSSTEVLPAAGRGAAKDGKWTHDPKWPHDWLEFHGDRLGIRVPRPSALTGFQMSQSKHNSSELRNESANLFLIEHLSEESWERVCNRSMDPDDTAYTLKTVAELINGLSVPAIKQLETELKELTDGADDQSK